MDAQQEPPPAMSHVLVVDNSEQDCQLVEQLLTTGRRYTVECAADHEIALRAIAIHTPDVVLVDSALEEVECADFVDSLRKEYPNVPVLLVSSKGFERHAIAALRKGASSYVPKDLLEDELLPTIRDLLEYSHRENCQMRMLEQMVEVHCRFVLDNDRGLIPPLVGYVQEHVRRIGLCGPAELTRIGIALDEALVNALYHGNLELSSELREDGDAYQQMAQQRMDQPPYRDRQLYVDVLITRDVAEIVIRDEGPGFDPSSLPDPRDPANLERVSGRGVLLMRTFMDEVAFNDLGNRVLLRKYRMDSPPPQDGAHNV